MPKVNSQEQVVTKKSKDGKPYTRDPVSLFFIAVGVAVIIVAMYLLFTNLIKASETNNNPIYYDNYLNFAVEIPQGWEVTNPAVDEVKNAVLTATDGVTFDMTYHYLPAEIVPLALVQTSTDTTKNRKLNRAKFMTLAFHPTDETYYQFDDKVALMDDMRRMLEFLEYEDIVVKEVIDHLSNRIKGHEELFGTAVYASAKVDGQQINYIQYFEPAGVNLMVVTYGSTLPHEKGIEDISEFLSTLTFFEGGQNFPASNQEEMKAEAKPDAQGTLISKEGTEYNLDGGSMVDEDGRSYHVHADGTVHYDDGGHDHDFDQVDEDGRKYHTHADGTIHYEDEPTSTGSEWTPTSVDGISVDGATTQPEIDESRPYHIHDDGSVHYEDEGGHEEEEGAFDQVDADGRKYHTHSDGTIHYED